MNIAIIKNSIVENIIVCETIEFAEELFPDALCLDAEAEGLGIGDAYPKQEPIPPPVDPVVSEVNILRAKVEALTYSNQMLEDCIVEMAEIVYA